MPVLNVCCKKQQQKVHSKRIKILFLIFIESIVLFSVDRKNKIIFYRGSPGR